MSHDGVLPEEKRLMHVVAPTVSTRRANFEKALAIFDRVLCKFKEKNNPNIEEIRDSVIIRFEFAYELFWKCVKETLADNYGVIVASPKTTFIEAKRLGLISTAWGDHCITMLTDRNNTVHAYDEELSEEIATNAQQHYNCMLDVAKKF